MNRRERMRKTAGKGVGYHDHAIEYGAQEKATTTEEIDYSLPRARVAREKKDVKRKKTKFMQKKRALKHGEPGNNQNYRANRVSRDYE